MDATELSAQGAGCQTARNRDPGSASNRGSDSLSVQVRYIWWVTLIRMPAYGTWIVSVAVARGPINRGHCDRAGPHPHHRSIPRRGGRMSRLRRTISAGAQLL